MHLMRGQVFTINGKTFFTFGGAQSHDISDGILETDDPRIAKWQYDYCKMFRINHISWWQEELPSQKEMDEGIENLAKYDNKVDYIITHCPPTKTLDVMNMSRGFFDKLKSDRLTDYLQEIQENIQYGEWYCGHMHENNRYKDDITVLYHYIIKIGGDAQ